MMKWCLNWCLWDHVFLCGTTVLHFYLCWLPLSIDNQFLQWGFSCIWLHWNYDNISINCSYQDLRLKVECELKPSEVRLWSYHLLQLIHSRRLSPVLLHVKTSLCAGRIEFSLFTWSCWHTKVSARWPQSACCSSSFHSRSLLRSPHILCGFLPFISPWSFLSCHTVKHTRTLPPASHTHTHKRFLSYTHSLSLSLTQIHTGPWRMWCAESCN